MAVASLGAVASVAFASVAGADLPGIEFGTRILPLSTDNPKRCTSPLRTTPSK